MSLPGDVTNDGDLGSPRASDSRDGTAADPDVPDFGLPRLLAAGLQEYVCRSRGSGQMLRSQSRVSYTVI